MTRGCDKPVLSHARLNQIAGKLPVHRKSAVRIQVAARSKRKAPRKSNPRTKNKNRVPVTKNKRNDPKNGTHFARSKNRRGNKNSSSSKRTVCEHNVSVFRQKRAEDPAGPISDGEFDSRPTKQFRSTPERNRRESCKSDLSPVPVVSCAGEAPTSTANGMDKRDAESPGVNRARNAESTPPPFVAPKQNEANQEMRLPVGNYGVISLFDGVSSVVPILCNKLRQLPAVAILAEVDTSLSELVAFEFGYCTQERWRFSFAGVPTIYVKDVRRLFDKGCFILLQVHRIAPTAKWFIVGGSPCQDLTYAGSFHGCSGLLDLTASCSSHFKEPFVLRSSLLVLKI